jgi:pimeloyl-ACP methyl ester carboxylesterase
MYYEVAGTGIPLLFVHGGLGGGRGSAPFRQYHMAELARYATVIAFDRRAAGASETPATGYSFDHFVTDIFALLDHLGHQRIVLMGTSAGGPQVLQAALTYPERIIGLILGSTASQTVHVPPELASLVTFLGTDGLTQLQMMFAAQDASAPPVAAGPTSFSLDRFGGVLQTYLAYHLHGDTVTTRLREITAPTLILHGTADEEVPFAEAERLHAHLTTSSLVPFVGGGHGIMVTHADAYRRVIIRFLDSLAKGAWSHSAAKGSTEGSKRCGEGPDRRSDTAEEKSG